MLGLRATVHGALPWTAEHERRSLLFRYVPGHMATGALEPPPPWVAELTLAQQTAFEPPSSSGRSLVNADGSVEHGASAEPDRCSWATAHGTSTRRRKAGRAPRSS